VNDISNIQAVYKKWADKGLVVLAINDVDTPSIAKEFMSEYGLTLLVLLDHEKSLSQLYRKSTGTYPLTIIIDTDGFIRHRQPIVFSCEEEIEGILNSL
jgi:peroxiredoxin